VIYQQKRKRHVAGIVEFNLITLYAVDPEEPREVTNDSRRAHDFGSEAAARDWCDQHPSFTPISRWSVGS